MRTTSPLRNAVLLELCKDYIGGFKEGKFHEYALDFNYFSIILNEKINLEICFNNENFKNRFERIKLSSIISDLESNNLSLECEERSYNKDDDEIKRLENERVEIKKKLIEERKKLTNDFTESDYYFENFIDNSFLSIKVNGEKYYIENYKTIADVSFYYNQIEPNNDLLLKELFIAIMHYFKVFNNPIVKSELLSLFAEKSKNKMHNHIISALLQKQAIENESHNYVQPYWKRQQEEYNRQRMQRDTGLFAGWF